MHEYSIVQSLYDAVMSQAAVRGATAVHEVYVRIGELSGVDVGLLDTAWKTFRVRTACEEAALIVVPAAAAWRCAACGEPRPKGRELTCLTCGGPLRLAQGDEILLERIVMEVSDV